ncbi:hypothetical protein, partial [uncultured Muribaculum sp.]|uniref:hypothetical protein n=1 Tax=uncultured Muribaculum sp. TaxID=1918613 RepID=UPI00272FE895
MSYAFAGCPALSVLDITGVGTWNLAGSYEGYGVASGVRGSGMHGMLAPTERTPLEGGYADGSGALAGGGQSNYLAISRTGAAAEASSQGHIEISLGTGTRRVFEGLFASQASATAAPDCVLAATSVVTVKGGPVAASDLAYRPDAFANGRSYVYAGRVVLADLAAFLASPNSWTPRRYADVLDLTEMDGVIGTTGSAFGKIVAGGFVGDVRDGVDGRSVCWAIRRADGEARGTLLVYPADTPEGMAEVAERGTEFAGQMMSFTDEVVLGASGEVISGPAPWSSLGDVNGTKMADDYTSARVYQGVRAGESMRSAFEGATSLERLDLTRVAWDAVTDASRMLAGCVALTSVADEAPVELPAAGAGATDADLDREEGAEIESGAALVALERARDISSLLEGATSLAVATLDGPGAWATGADASARRMLAGCTSLEEADISHVAEGARADATEMLAGSGAAGGDVRVASVATGDGAKATRMLEGAGFGTVEVDGVGTGTSADATRALAGMQSATSVTVRGSFTGGGAWTE